VDGKVSFVKIDDFDALASETSNPAETATPLATLPEHVLKNTAGGIEVPRGVGLLLTMGAVFGASLRL
jgi:hypothetical protein